MPVAVGSDANIDADFALVMVTTAKLRCISSAPIKVDSKEYQEKTDRDTDNHESRGGPLLRLHFIAQDHRPDQQVVEQGIATAVTISSHSQKYHKPATDRDQYADSQLPVHRDEVNHGR